MITFNQTDKTHAEILLNGYKIGDLMRTKSGYTYQIDGTVRSVEYSKRSLITKMIEIDYKIDLNFKRIKLKGGMLSIKDLTNG